MKYRWEFTPCNKENLDDLIKELNIPSFIAELLCKRGVDSLDKARVFFFPGPKKILRTPLNLKV